VNASRRFFEVCRDGGEHLPGRWRLLLLRRGVGLHAFPQSFPPSAAFYERVGPDESARVTNRCELCLDYLVAGRRPSILDGGRPRSEDFYGSPPYARSGFAVLEPFVDREALFEGGSERTWRRPARTRGFSAGTPPP